MTSHLQVVVLHRCAKYRESGEKVLTPTFTVPSHLIVSPRMALMREDLPQPTWPTIATKLPFLMSKLMLCNENNSWLAIYSFI